MAHNYVLQVTAGSEYDVNTHKIVPVNTSTPVSIDSELMSVDLNVRVQNYRGLPLASPNTSPYFSLPAHSKSGDQYSIAFRFTPKQSINGNDLVFGNDFDHPIRDRLPPGFSTALKIVKWAVDPGLDGDPYADEPYLYGPAASSVNVLHVGGKATKTETEDAEAGLVFKEGGDEEGMEHRREKGIPDGEAARKKFFLNEENRKGWQWEQGRGYGCDFFNPYLDFNEFALKLPGFTLPIMKYWDGQGLRYVLKNRATGKVLFVVLFTLYLKEDVDEEGNIKPGVMEQANVPFEKRDDDDEEEIAEVKVPGKAAEQNQQVVNAKADETNDDDVD
ncbi:hypothetical protein D0Z07_8624 [Hyphodiscus hymeniophilus]|uniref:Domain of unknown function at the cortex 1 domain-containing protein n=1 Tax=Hyphodiscus hymeniophilus TaxID=353542 RepID=A0A9P6VCC9_9HELO|nr:hypothetical protein D0Z07_8624 [Hyphodiscus hymeniophilus]